MPLPPFSAPGVPVAVATAAAMQDLASRLAQLVQPGDLILLDGPLGAGKTAFTQGLARGLGVTGRVTSPTFVLVREYHDGRVPLLHVDAYRLGGIDEVLDLDLDVEASVTVVEWGGNLAGTLLPDGEHLLVRIERSPSDEVRTVTLLPSGSGWRQRLET